MLALHPEFVVNDKAEKKAVLLPFSEWQRLMEDVEELEDIRAYDKAKAKHEGSVPFEEAVQRIQGRGRK
jgi:PHD/YefM family antitoxin component YafN of YafNO toxin-antitoxin module